MAKIETLVADIYSLFERDIRLDEGMVRAFGYRLGEVIAERLCRVQEKPTLRLSNLGTPCSRKLWYSINAPQLAEPLSAPTRIKFLFGDITEELALFFARASGHSVTDEQKTVEVNGIDGHIDALVDGELVDVKSASPYSFIKFASGLKPEDDSFGYLTQLGSYGHAVGGERAHFLAVDKVSGELVLDTHVQPEINYSRRADEARQMLAHPVPPPRAFEDVKDGESGNRKLGVTCSYCNFKKTCWPGLRFIPYKPPRWLTVVKREPKPRAYDSAE